MNAKSRRIIFGMSLVAVLVGLAGTAPGHATKGCVPDAGPAVVQGCAYVFDRSYTPEGFHTFAGFSGNVAGRDLTAGILCDYLYAEDVEKYSAVLYSPGVADISPEVARVPLGTFNPCPNF